MRLVVLLVCLLHLVPTDADACNTLELDGVWKFDFGTMRVFTNSGRRDGVTGDYNVKTQAADFKGLFTGKGVKDSESQLPNKCMISGSWVEHRPDGRASGDLLLKVMYRKDNHEVLVAVWTDEKTKKVFRWIGERPTR